MTYSVIRLTGAQGEEERGHNFLRSDPSYQRSASFETAPSRMMSKSSLLPDAASLVDAIAQQDDVAKIVDVVLQGLVERFGYKNLLILHHDRSRGVLVTLGSRGYEDAGIGSEIPVGEGVIGAVVADGHLINVSDVSRATQFARRGPSLSGHGKLPRMADLPSLPNAMSQIAVPLIAHGNIHGVLFAESRRRLAFTADDEAALTIIARQVAASLALAESLVHVARGSEVASPAKESAERAFRVSYHPLDDSVFIDNDYLIKGVAGRLLMFMLEAYQREGRQEFTNREIRLSSAMRLPDVKDNLDTRLILLRRRLEGKNMPIRILRVGRGRIRLQLCGTPLLERVD